jgi:hypothetical protein
MDLSCVQKVALHGATFGGEGGGGELGHLGLAMQGPARPLKPFNSADGVETFL